MGDGNGGVALQKIGDFEQPVYVTGSPFDDAVYVVEQCGRVIRVPPGGGQPRVFLEISDQVTCGGEQGLLSVAFDPIDETLLYVYFTDTDANQRIVEYRRSSADPTVADPASAREVLEMDDEAPNHNGGLLLFGPDRDLYVGTGDGGGEGDPERSAQDLSSPLGKILRIDPHDAGSEPYTIPGGNPYAGDPGARPEVLIRGLRNPWRFSFDQTTGDLWIGDVGQSTFEEIDAAPASQVDSGLNYGWSAFEGTDRFNSDQSAPGARPPVLEYSHDHGCSVTGGYVVRDRDLPTLYGRYLYGDYCAGQLRSFSADPQRMASDDRALGPRVAALSSFGIARGQIYVTSSQGPVYRLVPEPGG